MRHPEVPRSGGLFLPWVWEGDQAKLELFEIQIRLQVLLQGTGRVIAEFTVQYLDSDFLVTIEQVCGVGSWRWGPATA
jgi:hypothetical protein